MTTSSVEHATLPARVARWAAEDPGRVFLQDVGTTAAWSYGAVHEEGLRWAAAYRGQGVSAGDTVLTLMSTRVEFFFSWLGLAWERGIDVPVNTEYKGEMLLHVANNSGARVAVVEDRFLPRLLEVLPQLEHLERVVVLGRHDGLADAGRLKVVALDDFLAGPAIADPAPPAFHDLATVVYTSGTTGPSKGVLQPWGQIWRNVTATFPVDRFGADDAFYFTTPLYHQAGKFIPYLVALSGGRFVFREHFSAGEFWSDIRRFGCTWTGLLGVMAPFVVNQEPRDDDGDNPLRIAFMAPVPGDVEGFERRFGVEAITAYGMSEIPCPFSSVGYRVANSNAASCGRLVPGADVRIVDEHDRELPVGEIGELIVRGEPWELNVGYLGMPEASFAAWRNGWFHTGDLFRRDPDGFFYYVDRNKDAIRRRGENISSMEVERLVNSHPEVAATAAIAVPSEYSEDEIKVCIERRAGSELGAEDLLAYLVPIMPRFMVPRYVEFVDALPRTPTQRVKKAELRRDPFTAATWDRQAAGIELQR